MPSERRKIQNRINQRRYRMQIKNRIQLLEKAIIDSGVAINVDLGLSKPTTPGKDGDSSDRQSFSTSTSEPDLSLGLDLQNLTSWSGDPSPDLLDETTYFASHDFFDDWNPQDLDFGLKQCSLPYMPNSNQELEMRGSVSSGSSHQDFSPWRELAYVESPDKAFGSQLQTGSLETTTSTPNSGEEVLHQTYAREKPMDILSSKDGSQKPRTGQRKARDPKEKIIASLRQENKRLKELSTALVTMYDCTASPAAAAQEVSQSYDLHTTVNNLITRSFSLDASNSVQALGEHSENKQSTHREQPCSPSELGFLQLSTSNAEFTKICADLSGSFHQGAELQSPGAWYSHPEHSLLTGNPYTINSPTTPFSHASHASIPASLPGTNNFHNTLLNTTLPLPTTHAYLEPTFSRRLIRLLWEHAYNILTHTSTPLPYLKRKFGFCLLSRSKETLIHKFQAYLGLIQTPVSEDDRDIWNEAPDLRDRGEGDNEGAGSEWMEAGRVEAYLVDLGVQIGGLGTGVTFVPVVRPTQESGRSSGSASTTSTPESVQSAPQVPYGSTYQPDPSLTASLFGEQGNFHVPASWLVLSSTSSPPSTSSLAGTQNTTCLNAEQGEKCYLDIDRFFTGLAHVSVCLGRAAGFRRSDVDGVLRGCLVRF